MGQVTARTIARTRTQARAAAQHGLVTRAQLLALGIPERTLAEWCRRGLLVRRLPAVYELGPHAETPERPLWAAVLYAGPGAMLSHMTAAWWYGLIDFPPRGVVQVSTPRQISCRPGIQVFARRKLDRALHRSLPVTSVAQTVLDLAAVAQPRLVRKALANLDYRQELDIGALETRCGRRVAGSAALRQALTVHEPQLARVNGRLEEDFLEWCERHALPLPIVNVRVHGILVDAYWPEQRLVVELDGRANHSSPAQLRRDRRNDLLLREHGLTVARYDWALLHDEPRRLHRDLLGLLGLLG